MVRTKETATRMNIDLNRVRGKRIYPFRIKQTLPERKTVNITKNGKMVKTINARRKSRYFNGRNRLIF